MAVDGRYAVADGLYYSVRPMLAVSGGRLVTLSTPSGDRGWWHKVWRDGQDWARWEVPASECPRISPEFLEEEQRELGEYFYRQEYQCEFLPSESYAFTREEVEAAIESEVDAWEF